MTKHLASKDARIGAVFRIGDDKPIGVGQLTITGEQILLQMPTDLGISMHMELPDPFAEATQPAFLRRLVFVDNSLKIGLGDCRIIGQSSNWGGDLTGRLRISARSAVTLGKRTDNYFEISGLRSEIDGLSAWTSLSSVEKTVHHDDVGLISGLTTSAHSQPPLAIGSALGLEFNPHFSFDESRVDGTHTITEKVLVQTMVDEPIDWDEHVRVHQSVQDLLTIAYWRRCTLRVSGVANKNHPIIDPSNGTGLGTKWQSAVSTWNGRANPAASSVLTDGDFPIFTFADIGASGVRRWVDEKEEWSRIVGPLSSSRFQRGATIEVFLLQVGVAIEALGYKIAERDGSLNPQGQLAFPQYLRRIHDSLDCSVAGVLRGDDQNNVGPFTGFDEWANAFNALYKGAKHADQPPPDPVRAWVIASSGALLVRLWLAREFGVPRENLERSADFAG